MLLTGQQDTDSALFGQVLGDGCLRGEVKDQNVEAAKEGPDGFIVRGCAIRLQMGTKRRHKGAHRLARDLWKQETLVEAGGVAQFSRPGQKVLIRTINLFRVVCRCHRELAPRVPKVRCQNCRRDLFHNSGKDLVGRSEVDVPFDLYFELEYLSRRIMAMDNHVVQGVPLGCPLQANMLNRATREAAGLCTGKHGQQIISADLSLEMWSSRTAGRRARHLLPRSLSQGPIASPLSPKPR